MREVFQDYDAEQGIATRVHADDGKIVLQKTFDAEPLLDYAKRQREATDGKRWGDGKIIGTVPMAVVGQFIRQDGRLDAARLTEWIRENPAFICFDKFK